MFSVNTYAIDTPHTVKGYVYDDNGNPVPRGTSVLVENLAKQLNYSIVTSGPGQITNFYSVSILGEAGDEIRVSVERNDQTGESNGILTDSPLWIDVRIQDIQIPEFITSAALVAVCGALVAFILIRRK
jgi:hypothetical protein